LVCKQYSKIVDSHEWWRGFTGATAHFEPLHIGFNMMSLHTLGKELEGGLYGSINFFMYNVALVVMTTIVMMAMVYGRLRFQRGLNDDERIRLRETSSVGYSAVLFAWMVISTLERDQATCPIPFFNDLCFSTYSYGELKFNISPVVSLFVAQFIMPRVSFMGHLAGIICGFCLHWGWPPIEIGSPNVLIGGVFLIGNLFWRGVVPVVPLVPPDYDDHDEDNQLLSLLLESDQDGIDGILMSLSGNADVENGNGHHLNGDNTASMDPFTRSKERKKEREMEEMRRKHKTLGSIRNLIGLVTILSFLFFDWVSSIALSQCILFAYFIFGTRSSFIVWAYTQAKVESDVVSPEKQRCGMIWRGYFMTCILAIVVDAMSTAGWIPLRTVISLEQVQLLFGLVPTLMFMFLRIAINILGLVIASKVLHDMGQVSYASGGIFVRVFSRVLTSSKAVGDGVFLSQRPMWTAFEGRGIRLGGGELLSRISRSRV
jgi:membrane associated rhomboid family serine protease